MKITLITPGKIYFDQMPEWYDIKDCLEAIEGGFTLTLVKAENKEEAIKKYEAYNSDGNYSEDIKWYDSDVYVLDDLLLLTEDKVFVFEDNKLINDEPISMQQYVNSLNDYIYALDQNGWEQNVEQLKWFEKKDELDLELTKTSPRELSKEEWNKISEKCDINDEWTNNNFYFTKIKDVDYIVQISCGRHQKSQNAYYIYALEPFLKASMIVEYPTTQQKIAEILAKQQEKHDEKTNND